MLLKFLNEGQATLVRMAIAAGIPIVVDGDRTKPTGKSTLCDYLKSVDAVACEAWELEEGENADKKLPNGNTDSNSVIVTVRLDRALFTRNA